MSSMPAACRTLGYAGYPNKPTETVWSKHVAERLSTVGIDTYTNNSNEKSSGMPDTVMQGPFGFVYIEFKGPNTPVRGNQCLIAAKMNAKSFYTRGELCCFVYRAPDLFGVLRSDGTIVPLFSCDALAYPGRFVDNLTSRIEAVMIEDTALDIEDRAKLLDLPVLPTKKFEVRQIALNASASKEVFAPSKQLALKLAVGCIPRHEADIVCQSYYIAKEV